MGIISGVNAVNDGLIFSIDAGNSFCYPKVSYGTVCGTANEGLNLTLTAPAGGVFDQINYASYGTPNGTCGLYTNGACHATGSTTIVGTYLLNNSTGTIPATNGVFGDPCGGTYKRLYVEARYRSNDANNLTGNASNASLVNGIGFTTSNVGYFSFDGTNDYMNIPTTLSINASSFSSVVIFKLTTNADGNSLLNLNYLSPSSGYLIRQNASNNIIVYTNNGTETSISSTATLSTNTIYHLCVIQNSGVCSIYINGSLDKSASLSNPVLTSSYESYIGRRGGPSIGAYLSGSVSQVQIYNRALSAAEVRQNYNSTKRRYL